jgi:hypothetical protein
VRGSRSTRAPARRLAEDPVHHVLREREPQLTNIGAEMGCHARERVDPTIDRRLERVDDERHVRRVGEHRGDEPDVVTAPVVRVGGQLGRRDHKRLDHVAQRRLRRRFDPPHPHGSARRHVGRAPIEDRSDQRRLRPEVVMDRRGVRAGFVRDVADRDRVDPALREEALGGAHQPFARRRADSGIGGSHARTRFVSTGRSRLSRISAALTLAPGGRPARQSRAR